MGLDYSLVVGLDRKHNEQLKVVLPTWLKHKPELKEVPLIAFYDRRELRAFHCWWLYDDIHPVTLQPWPFTGSEYPGTHDSKWDNPQRNLMLSGFIHVPALLVETEYWLKLDTDVVAHGVPDWIDPDWFQGDPAIVAPKWHYTKPADQMLKLDDWSDRHGLFSTPSLNLAPNPGSKLVKHQRICSWCAFFQTEFSRKAARLAMAEYVGSDWLQYTSPAPSQDGYHWYAAERMAEPIVRVLDMKERGWSFHSRDSSIAEAVKESMA